MPTTCGGAVVGGRASQPCTRRRLKYPQSSGLRLHIETWACLRGMDLLPRRVRFARTWTPSSRIVDRQERSGVTFCSPGSPRAVSSPLNAVSGTCLPITTWWHVRVVRSTTCSFLPPREKQLPIPWLNPTLNFGPSEAHRHSRRCRTAWPRLFPPLQRAKDRVEASGTRPHRSRKRWHVHLHPRSGANGTRLRHRQT